MSNTYNHTVYMTKKWVGGGSSSASTITHKLASIHSSINVETPTTRKGYPDVMNVKQALRRVRMGGYTVPKKVSQKR